MRSPKSLETLADHGIIQEVLRPLMSGKEAQIYMVVSDDRVCAAKIYKESQNRSFKHRTDYTEGRKVRNSRDQRAMAKGSKYGKSKDEDAWRTTEVDMIYRLRAAGVRVPEPYVFIDGVLVMELVCDYDGNPAPRLGDVSFTPQEATQIYHLVLQEVVRMLSAGVVHGDLSDFNVLLAHDGPVVIDFPQSVEAAGNLNARRLLLRDVDNLHRFLERSVPGARRKPYGEEIWSLYENNRLTPETKLTGNFKRSSARVDTSAVLELIGDANHDEIRRRERTGGARGGEVPVESEAATPMRRREIVIEKPAARGARPSHGGPRSSDSNTRGGGTGSGQGRPASGARASDRGSPSGNRFGRDGQRGSGDRGRSSDPRHSRGGPDQKNKSGPKRGDGVQNSAYVSPEARKVKPLSLTPRSGSSSEEKPRERSEGGRNRRGGDARRGSESRPGDQKRGGRSPANEARPSGSRPEPRQRRARAPRSTEGEARVSTTRSEAPAQSTEASGGDRRARARARRDERMSAQGRDTNRSQPSPASQARAPSPSSRSSSSPEAQESTPRRRRRRPRGDAKTSSGSTD